MTFVYKGSMESAESDTSSIISKLVVATKTNLRQVLKLRSAPLEQKILREYNPVNI